MAHPLRTAVFTLAFGSIAASLVACSGELATEPSADADVTAAGGNTLEAASGGSSNLEGEPSSGGTGITSNAGGSISTNTTSGGSGNTTQTVCTPAACSDTPRSSESCAQAQEWGFCETDWFGEYCHQTCGTCEGSAEEVCVEIDIPNTETNGAGGSTQTGSGGSNGGTSVVTPVPGGSPTGWGSRYWDCCKQHCSWPENAPSGPAISCNSQDQTLSDESTQSSCGGGSAHTCWSMAPWAVSSNLAYGYAAVPPGGSCGKCYQLDFNGKGQNVANDPGSVSLSGKTMIVQATNIGGDVNNGQFDILIPGGGVGAFNACSSQWGVSDLGAQYGGFLTTCKEDVGCLRNKCNSTFSGKPELLAGCLFHADWMGGANNPQFKYAQVSCPAALEQASGMTD